MRTLLCFFAFLATPTIVLAQVVEEVVGFVFRWEEIVAMLIMGVGIPLAVQILLSWWPTAPSLLKTLSPLVVAPLLLTAGVWLTGWLGVPIDFGPIIDIIMGGVALGVASTTAFKLGAGKPTGFVASVKTIAGKR